jgi:hypothetical protein
MQLLVVTPYEKNAEWGRALQTTDGGELLLLDILGDLLGTTPRPALILRPHFFLVVLVLCPPHGVIMAECGVEPVRYRRVTHIFIYTEIL